MKEQKACYVNTDFALSRADTEKSGFDIKLEPLFNSTEYKCSFDPGCLVYKKPVLEKQKIRDT